MSRLSYLDSMSFLLSGVLPFLLRNASAEVWRDVDISRLTTPQQVVDFLNYYSANAGKPGAVASLDADGAICWRHDRTLTPRGENEWRHSEFVAENFSRPGLEVLVVPKYFRYGVDRWGIDRLWSLPS